MQSGMPEPLPTASEALLPSKAQPMAVDVVVLPTPISPKSISLFPAFISSDAASKPAQTALNASASDMAFSFRKSLVPSRTLR